MGSLLQDVRCAVRSLRKSPGFSIVAVLTLALGIGANTAIFSLIDRVVLHPLDVPDGDRLIILQQRFPPSTVARDTFLYDDYLRSRHARATVEQVAAFGQFGLMTVGYGNETTQVPALFVSANYFDMFMVRAARLGRTLRATDDSPSGEPVAVLSERAWRTRFGADPTVTGRTIRVSGMPVVIVGVAAAGVGGTRLGVDPPELFLPIESARRLVTIPGNRFSRGVLNGFSPTAWLSIIARLRNGATAAQAEAELSTLLGSDTRRYGSLSVTPLANTVVPLRSRDDLVRFTALTAGAVALTLLIACANVASLLLARLDDRRIELAVRTALGAGRWQLIKQLVMEIGLVAGLGGCAALVIASWVDAGLGNFQLPGGISIAALRSANDRRVVLFTMSLAIVAAVLCGIAPTLRGINRDPIADLKRQASGSTKLRATRVLVGLQVALCMMLAFGAGLFVRSLSNALATDMGFDARNLMLASAFPQAIGYDEARARNYVTTLFDRIKQLPGVESATLGPAPLAGFGGVTPVVRVDGVSTTPPTHPISVDSNDMVFTEYIGPNYFSTLRQPLASGRDFAMADETGARPVAIVSASLARRFWPNQTALGHRIGFLPLKVDLEIIGIVRDVTQVSLRDHERLSVYVPRTVAPPFEKAFASVVVRSVGGARDRTIRSLHRAAVELDPNLPLTVRTIDERVGTMLMPQRLGRSLLGWLAMMALTLTIVGVYGLVMCVVARSTREIGVRIALGAKALDVLRHIAGRALAPVAIGVLVGSAAAAWAGRFADRFMYGIRGSSAGTLGVVAASLIMVAAVAAMLPARRAARVDPVVALRAE